MTKQLARKLILVLAAKRIAFRIQRNANAYAVSYGSAYIDEVKRALGG
jgi:hypothetical protein